MNIPMIDTLTATIDIVNYEQSAKDLIIALENKKNEAKSLASKCINEKITIVINNLTFEVLANGSKGYAYILHNEDYEVKLSQFRSKNEGFYPVFIKIKSEYLWSNGPERSWNNILKWINESIGQVIQNKINRFDLCCHTDELCLTESDFETFKGNYHSDQLFRYMRKVNAMVFGSRDSKVYCRIYDKTLETKLMKKKMWFFDIWDRKGLDVERVWNVEFELKREFFKDNKIDSVEDAFQRIKTIWLYCTSEYLVKIRLERTRKERCPTDNVWISIQNAFSDYKDEKLISREKQFDTEALALIPGTIGNLTSFAARMGENDIEEVLRRLKNNGSQYLKGKRKDYVQVINEKMSLLNINVNEV